MARFYAEIKGNRGKASRQGFKDSGMWGHIRGWNSGVEVECRVDSEDLDYIEVYATKGSSGYGGRKLIAILYEDGEVELISNKGHQSNIVIKPSMIQNIGYRGED